MEEMDEFDYEELEAATENFSSSRVIGRGSHGCIYKGILKDGKLLAIKKQSLGFQKLQDNSKIDNEIRVLGSLPRNPYLITLLGTSHDCVGNKLLVMEHMPNGNLHDLLHLAPTPPSWPKRFQLAIQIAKAVHFIHEANPLVIHRDIKSANILFDSNWKPVLADFGLAIRQGQRVDSDSLTRPAGTIGYLDPCYTTPCRLSTKNDVFSFGVVILELISSTKAIDVSRNPSSIVEWALPLIEEDRAVEICDRRVVVPSRHIESRIRHMLHVAARCVSCNEDHRPSMGEIINEMENCFVEHIHFPISIDVVRRILEKRPRMIAKQKSNTTVTAATAAITAGHGEFSKQKSNTTVTAATAATTAGHGEFSKGKMLLREVLADIRLE